MAHALATLLHTLPTILVLVSDRHHMSAFYIPYVFVTPNVYFLHTISRDLHATLAADSLPPALAILAFVTSSLHTIHFSWPSCHVGQFFVTCSSELFQSRVEECRYCCHMEQVIEFKTRPFFTSKASMSLTRCGFKCIQLIIVQSPNTWHAYLDYGLVAHF